MERRSLEGARGTGHPCSLLLDPCDSCRLRMHLVQSEHPRLEAPHPPRSTGELVCCLGHEGQVIHGEQGKKGDGERRRCVRTTRDGVKESYAGLTGPMASRSRRAEPCDGGQPCRNGLSWRRGKGVSGTRGSQGHHAEVSADEFRSAPGSPTQTAPLCLHCLGAPTSSVGPL